MKKNHKKEEILNIIKAIRLSFLEAAIIYTMGGCYGFYKILKAIYPTAMPYMTEDHQHIVTKINNKYYDIKGEFLDLDGKIKCGLVKLNKDQKNYWESVISTQTAKYILNKK